jgi:ribonuclease Z
VIFLPEITLLGTGGMMPLKDRYLSSCYIEQNGRAILIDCGEGTQVALSEFGCKISRIDMLMFTHVHADHISGLPGFLLSLGNSSRCEPLEIYMPKGTVQIAKKLICICDRLPFELRFHELPTDRAAAFIGEKIDPLLEIKSLPLRHSADCLGYSFEFKRKPVFLPEKAKALGIPVEFWRRLHSGEAVELNGEKITPETVTGEERHAAKIAYVTDTLPIGGIADFARGADLFICEGMYGDTDKKQSMNQKGHMLMQDACTLAAKAEVSRLWLTHYSPAEKYPRNFETKLKKIFGNVTVSHDGEKIIL